MSPVLGWPPRAPRSRPVKPGAQATGVGKGTTASGKPTGAPRATGPDEARRTTRGHEARQRGTPPATTKAHGQVPSHNGSRVPQTRRARTTRTYTAQEQVPSDTSRRPDGPVRARRVPSPYRLRTAAVRMDECAPGGYPAPTGYKQLPSGWTSPRPEGTQPLPATNSRRPDGRVSAPQQLPAHATPHAQPKAQQRANTPVYKSQAAQDIVHATQPMKQAHRRTGAKWPRTPHTQHNTSSEHTGEQEPGGPGHPTRKTTHRAGTPVNRSQVARDTAQAKQRTERAHR